MRLHFDLLSVGMACLFGLNASPCLADIDEGKFADYTEGEVLGQGAWLPQGLDSRGTYTAQEGRAEIRNDAKRKEKTLIWKSGFEGRDQTRLLKHFPATRGDKVVVKFDFLPGNPTLGAQLVFDRGLPGGEALRFVKGSLQVVILDGSAAMDTKVPFNPNDWNRIEMHFDFEGHTVEVFLNGDSAGSYSLSPKLTGLNEIVLFAGGATFESGLADFSVESVTSFDAPKQTAGAASK